MNHLIAMLIFMLPISATFGISCGTGKMVQISEMDKYGKITMHTTAEFKTAPHDWYLTAKICGTGLAAAYLGMCAHLFYKGWKLLKKDSWALWHEEVSLQALYQLPQKTVAQELFSALIEHYPEAYNSVDAVSRFVNDINTEIYHLEKFRTLHTVLDLLNLDIIFPRQKDKMLAALERIERLNYLKQVIWFASIDTQPLQPHGAPAA